MTPREKRDVTRTSVALERERGRPLAAELATRGIDDSLRRYEPDQVLRVSLSLRPTWAGTPVNEET